MRRLGTAKVSIVEFVIVSLVGLSGCGESSASDPPSDWIGPVGGWFGTGAQWGSGVFGGGPPGSGAFGAWGQGGAGAFGAGQGGIVIVGQGGIPIGVIGNGGNGGNGGIVGNGGVVGNGGIIGNGGVIGNGGIVGSGAVVGSGGVAGGTCAGSPVTGLSLRAVDAYQSVQIPIMKAGDAVAPSQRNADVVVGRKTVFRVQVTPEAGWTPRQVAARIELTDVTTNQTKVFDAVLTPTTASSDADLKSTFQVNVPADAIGADTSYAVALVECDAAPPAGDATHARFPSQGSEPLAARKTGPLKVNVIPAGGTNVTMQVLEPFKQRLEAVYPITDVQFTIAAPLTASATSMCTLVASVSSRRSQDNPPKDVYYFALTPGILGGQSGCSNVGSKVSVGWAQGYTPDDGRTGAATMCHELGHAHGRQHAPCNVSDPDPGYPYPGANIGVWGYDQRSGEFREPTSKDMMSYCPEPRWSAWISDYNYQAIVDRVASVNGQPEIPAPLDASVAPVSWRLLVSDSAGVHWIKERLLVRGTPDGDPVSAVIHRADGSKAQVIVYKQRLEDGVSDSAFMLTLPEPDASWGAIEVPGLLARQPL